MYDDSKTNTAFMDTNKNYFLALNRMPRIGPKTVQTLLKQWPSLAIPFAMSIPQLIHSGLSIEIAKTIHEFDMRHIEEDLIWEKQQNNHHLLTWEHPAYPALLREIHYPPIVLYASGNLSCFNFPTLAIVGTRTPSAIGRKITKQFAFELTNEGITLISGLALGIDAEAHLSCLAAAGYTIAVLGTGINKIYPSQHIQLADKIQEKGLILSEFPLNTPPIARHFPQRNRIISGLSLAVLVVEAAMKSGSLITAQWAIEQNREVMAIPGAIDQPQSRGCHYLLQQGARLVTSVHDILEGMNLESLSSTQKKQSKPLVQEAHYLVDYSKQEIDVSLTNYFDRGMTSFDQLILRSGLTFDEVACHLATLELEGLVKAVSGGYVLK